MQVISITILQLNLLSEVLADNLEVRSKAAALVTQIIHVHNVVEAGASLNVRNLLDNGICLLDNGEEM